MKESHIRINFVDIAKGILIVLVILHHLPQYARHVVGINNVFLTRIDSLCVYYACFFMPAFFLLSGYCSNFDKPFFVFLRNNIRTILFPMLCFFIICNTVKNITSYNFEWLNVFLQKSFYIHFIEDYWFLSAMFIIRMLYWVLHRCVKSDLILWIILLTLMVFGIWQSNIEGIENADDFQNPWHYKNAFGMCMFLVIGHKIKNRHINEQLLFIFSCIFVLTLSSLTLLHIPIPVYTHHCGVSVLQVPLFIVLALLGTAFIVYISKIIRHNYFLEAMGKHSLSVYALQILMLHYSEWLIIRIGLFPKTYLQGIVFYILTAIISIVLCYFSSLFLNLKYLRIVTGKYN